jgi:hypothetical protein
MCFCTFSCNVESLRRSFFKLNSRNLTYICAVDSSIVEENLQWDARASDTEGPAASLHYRTPNWADEHWLARSEAPLEIASPNASQPTLTSLPSATSQLEFEEPVRAGDTHPIDQSIFDRAPHESQTPPRSRVVSDRITIVANSATMLTICGCIVPDILDSSNSTSSNDAPRQQLSTLITIPVPPIDDIASTVAQSPIHKPRSVLQLVSSLSVRVPRSTCSHACTTQMFETMSSLRNNPIAEMSSTLLRMCGLANDPER